MGDILGQRTFCCSERGEGALGALRQIGNCAHLIHGLEHFVVAVDDDPNRENEAKERVEDEIAVVVP